MSSLQAAPVTILRFADAATASETLAQNVAQALREGLHARGQASLVVSGGRSPLAFFAALRRQALDWSRVGITLADERWVATDALDSNERLLREHLVVGNAATARLVSLKTAHQAPDAACVEVWAALGSLPRPFDAVVLGMGPDGHFASLFPDMPGLASALDETADPAVVPGRAPSTPTARISLNLAALLQARRVFLPIQGLEKQSVLAAAQADPAHSPYPVAALFRQRRTPLVVHLIES